MSEKDEKERPDDKTPATGEENTAAQAPAGEGAEKAPEPVPEQAAPQGKKKKAGGRRNKAPKEEAASTGEGGEQAPPPNGAAQRPPAASGGKGPWAIAVLALLFTLLVAAGGAWFWWQDQLRRQQMDQRLAQLDQRIGQAPAAADLQALAARLEELGQRLDQVDRLRTEVTDLKRQTAEVEARMKAALDRLYQRMGRSSVDWILAEAEYLLRLANERLQLAHDPDTARAALQAADGRLAALDDPALQPVREAIAREIAALEALPRVDVAGLAARLDALAGQIEKLPLARRYLPPEPLTGGDAGETTASGEGPWWERAWERLKDTIAGLVVVRYNEQPVAPLLAPDQVSALRQGLALELELARAALVRGDEALYRQSLERTARLVRQYFDPEDAATAALLQTLDELAGQRIRVTYPDLSESLRRLRDAKARIGGDGGEAAS